MQLLYKWLRKDYGESNMAQKIPSKVQEIRDFKIEKADGDKSISFSQLSLYISCPLRWYRAYVLKEAPYVPTIHTTFGTAFHETVQEWLDVLYNRSVKEAEGVDLEANLETKLKEVYQKECEALGKHFSTAEELAQFYMEGCEILKYIKKNRISWFDSRDWLVGCEIPIYTNLKGQFYFKGYIDVLIYDEILDKWIILDIKTSRSGWSSKVKADFLKTSQVLLYKEFLSRQFGIDPKKIEVKYFIVKRQIDENAPYLAMKKRVQEFSPVAGPRKVKQAVSMVSEFMEGALTDTGEYQDREYEALPSATNCKYCLFKDSCEHVVS